MSPSDNSPGNHDQHLGEGGTHEVVFSNSGGKIKIETVTPDTISGATNNLASQLGETVPGIVMPPPELNKDDTGTPDDDDTGIDDTDTPDDTSDTGDDDTDTTSHDDRGTPQPLRIAVPGLKKTVEGD